MINEETYLDPIEQICFTFPHETNYLIKNAKLFFKLRQTNKVFLEAEKEKLQGLKEKLLDINREEILNYLNRELVWDLPKNLLSSLEAAQTRNYIFNLTINNPKNFILGRPEKIQFEISRNIYENMNICNIEIGNYLLCLQKFSKDWIIVGDLEKKIDIAEDNQICRLDFQIIPINVGLIELPKFRISCVKNNFLTSLLELKREDCEKTDNENIFHLQNNEIRTIFSYGNKVIVHGLEKLKAEYVVIV